MHNPTQSPSLHRIPLTGPNQDRAIENARQLLEIVESSTDDDFASVVESAWRAARGQSRWIVVGRNRSEMISSLAEFVLDGSCLASGTYRPGGRRVTFVFSGMGPQWSGMGRQLADKLPGFAERIKAIDDLLLPHHGGSVWDELTQYEMKQQLPTALAQPGNFLIQAALHDVLVAEGVVPDAVVGHSAGEVAAAYAAGVYDLDEGARVAVTRGRLQATLAGRGAMLAVGLSEDEAVELISSFDGVDLAAVNDHEAVTVAGDADQIAEIETRLKEAGIFAKTLRVEVPYHSPVMDEIADDLREQMNFIRPKPAIVPLYSTVSGKLSTGEEWGAEYWVRNVRQPVRFAKAIDAALADGSRSFVEIAPHPVLTPSLTALAPAESATSVVPLLSRRDDEYEMFVGGLGKLAVEGTGRPRRTASAPLIAPTRATQSLWDLDPWYDEHRIKSHAVAGVRLLGQRVEDHHDEWDVEVSTADQPWIEGHEAQGLGAVVPATMWAELVGLMATNGQDASVTINDLTIVGGLPVFDNPTIIRMSQRGGTVRLQSRSLGDTQSWNLNAVASIGSPLPVSDAPAPDFDPPSGEGLDEDNLYRLFRLKGLHYSGFFRNLSDVILPGDVTFDANGAATGDLVAWATIDGGAPFTDGLHAPWVLDAGLQLLIAAARDLAEVMYLPYRLGRVSLLRPMNDGAQYKARAVVHSRSDQELVGDIRYFDLDGRLCAEMTDVVVVRNGSDDAARRSYLDRNTFGLRSVTPLEVFERFLPEEVIDLDGDDYDQADEVGAGVGLELGGSDGTAALTIEQPPFFDDGAHDDAEPVPLFWIAENDAALALPLDLPTMQLGDVPHDANAHLLWMVPNGDRTNDIITTFAFLNEVRDLDDPSITLTLIGAPEQHWLFGLRRSANNAGMNVRVIITDDETPSDELELWVVGLEELEVCLDGQTRLNRLEKLTADDLQATVLDQNASQQTTLAFDVPSVGASTTTVEPVRSPGPGEITIETMAVPLNWKDVGKVTGAIGTNALATFAGNHLGIGALGKVVDVGPGSDFTVGEIVAGAIRRPFRQRLTVNADDEYVVHLRAGVDPVVQLALMMPWVTALAALDDMARVTAGDRVFIQSGAGALGAVLCRHAINRGCDVVTSVGTPDKVEVLKAQFGDAVDVIIARGDEIPGVLLDSAHEDFDCITAVLNGPSRSSLFQMLRPRGRYIDLGKAATSDEMQLATAIDGNRSLARIDTDQIAAADPAWFSDLIQRSLDMAADPANHTPVSRYSIANLREAILELARGTTTGSLIIEFDDDMSTEQPTKAAPRFDHDGIYLITGGYGGVGLMCAQWLVSRGARTVVLTGRSGRATERSQATIDMLRAFGADIQVVATDGSDLAAVHALIADLRKQGPLRGVIHAAGVIADGPFDEVDEDRVRLSMGAKVDGANNLVTALDHADGAWDDLSFVLFTSSLAGCFGVSIQSTYAAANTCLDGLANDLQTRGVQASSMMLGPIAEAGMAADDERNIRFYEATGLSVVQPRDLFGILDVAATTSVPVFVTAEIDWKRVGRAEPGNAGSSVIGHLIAAAQGAGGGAHLAELLELSIADRTEVLTLALLGLFVDTLGLEEGDLSAETSFPDMGIDSLAVVEIQFGIGEILQYELPLARLFRPDGNVGQLSARIAEYLDEIDISGDELPTDDDSRERATV